jgi:asparagine synthase (glutamine-hydrolysing)
MENLSLPHWASLFEHYDPGATGLITELRHPYFDLRMLDYLLALPSVPWCVDKQLLREAMRGRLPEEVRCRNKAPLAGYPDYGKLRQDAAGSIPLVVAKATSELGRFVDVHRLMNIVRHPERLRPSEYTLITRPLGLAIWLRQVESGRPRIRMREEHEVKGQEAC